MSHTTKEYDMLIEARRPTAFARRDKCAARLSDIMQKLSVVHAALKHVLNLNLVSPVFGDIISRAANYLDTIYFDFLDYGVIASGTYTGARRPSVLPPAKAPHVDTFPMWGPCIDMEAEESDTCSTIDT
ncbi:hypothetical protein FGB62_124g011 [Gracilaria domingensis]|nr:hypothetical protein FGB62_124g010 [Gracilaria domingensis]KAI0560122.1 hypothetical protein FGB62_124g011 [Gracilaria domingensis]